MSVGAQLAQQTKLYIEGSSGSAEALTAIALGYPTILTITGNEGVANGDVVALAGFTGDDAANLNGESFTVQYYADGDTNGSFAIDYDSTGESITIGSATATPAAWTQVTEIKAIKPAGAVASDIDVTDLDSTAKEYRTGLMDNGALAFDIFILPADSGQAACLAAFIASTVHNFKVVSPGASGDVTRTFAGSVRKWPTIPDSSVDGVQTGSAELRVSGTVTVS